MKLPPSGALLEQGLAELASARRHLDYSFEETKRVDPTLAGISERQLESVEAFTGRFARVVDLLVNKVLRGVDQFEIEPPGTLLDVLNRAEKRGLIARAADLREMKMVRNAIAHDYAGAEAPAIFAFCREKKAALDRAGDHVSAYARNLISGAEPSAIKPACEDSVESPEDPPPP